VSLFGSYVYNHASSNTDGLNTFAANPRDFNGEYGPATTDQRHRVSLGGSINARWNVRLSPLIILDSGPPVDITAGRDVYGNTLFNGRPGIATDPTRPGLLATRYGLLDPGATPAERILPRNYGRGPAAERADAAWTGPGSGAGNRSPSGAFGSGASGPASSVVKRRFN
jgi:hypothetical protein